MTIAADTSVVTYEVLVNGSAINDKIQIYGINVEQAINRISTASIKILDGNPSQENFKVSASDTFLPGNKLTIQAGYDSQNKVLFEGIITRQSIQASSYTGPLLEIECRDSAVKMTVGRKSASYSEKKDSDVISTLIGNAGLSSSVSATSTEIPILVQYYATDWDFILSRAEVNSLVVSTINGKVSVFDPTSSTSPVLKLTYGDNLFNFHGDLNAVTQLSEVKASAWDYQNQKLISATASNNLPGPGNLSSKKLASVVGLTQYELQTPSAESNDELSSWAKGRMLKSELAKIIGEARAQGTNEVTPGKYVTLDGLGPRFDGGHFVSCVRHEISEGNWFTDINIGLSPLWFVEENDVQAPDAAGLIPGIQGLYTGSVKKIYEDPDNEYRILVEIALFNDQGEGVWARLANFYSTAGKGVFFLPEVGDEVVLGFLNQDPRYPIILGSVYSQKNKPYSEFSPNEKNNMKGIVSKSELRMTFNDEDVVLSLITPNKNSLVLDDKNKKIEIKDQNGNSIILGESGINIKSQKSINLEASQNITIKGNSGVSVQASGGDVVVKGMNIQETADMEFSAKGNMTASVEGGTALTLKGAMVMIN